MKAFYVEIESEGKKYTAAASVEGGMLTVKAVNLGERSSSVSSDNEGLAKLLLRELVNGSKGKGWK